MFVVNSLYLYDGKATANYLYRLYEKDGSVCHPFLTTAALCDYVRARLLLDFDSCARAGFRPLTRDIKAFESEIGSIIATLRREADAKSGESSVRTVKAFCFGVPSVWFQVSVELLDHCELDYFDFWG